MCISCLWARLGRTQGESIRITRAHRRLYGQSDPKNDPKVLQNIPKVIPSYPSSYIKSLNLKGILMISGFYDKDVPLLKNMSNDFKLQLIEQKEKDKWSALKFKNE